MHNTPDSKPRASRRKPVPIDLGLQGGGAHGAFTWGVLDRLLDEPWLQFDGISGTSAGAMNAAVMASGYVHGGPEGAKAALATFWHLGIAEAARRACAASALSVTRLGAQGGMPTLAELDQFLASRS